MTDLEKARDDMLADLARIERDTKNVLAKVYDIREKLEIVPDMLRMVAIGTMALELDDMIGCIGLTDD